MSLQGVKGARVHLVLPERRLFAAREETASASVVVKLTNSANFGRREVAAIVHLVSTAVPGLSKERVSVVSTEGLTLHRPNNDTAGDSGGGGDSSLGEQARLLSSQFESEVQQQLERVVGIGNADARVSVELNPSTRERMEELYEPAKTALRSEQKVEESTGATEAGVAGVPGARSNLPDAKTGPSSEETATATGGGVRRSHTRNWEVQRVTDKTTTPPGDIRRVSVGVVLNGRYEKQGENWKFVPRGAEEIKSLEEVVRRTVGFNEARGDTVSVQAAQFARLESDVDSNSQLSYLRYLPWLVAGGVLLAVVSAVVLVWRSKAQKGNVVQVANLAADGSAVPAALGGAPGAKALSETRTHLLEPARDQAELRAKAMDLATQDPATAAGVLRQWLATPARPT
jgi:flagellar M-ring protein FliF